MSGHNKWSKIKRKKAASDVKKGAIFSRLIKEITVAARQGGGDPRVNSQLRIAIEKAQSANMPAENIKRAIQRGTGELPGVAYERITYEGYAPGGVALIIESLTDNKNRTVSEIRHLFERYNGKLGATNSVAWIFHRKGLIHVPRTAYDENELLSIILEAGAEDMKIDDDNYEIVAAPENFETVRQTLISRNIKIEDADIHLIPENTVRVEGKEAEQVLRLVEALEEHDDVQQIYANYDIDENIMASFNSQQ